MSKLSLAVLCALCLLVASCESPPSGRAKARSAKATPLDQVAPRVSSLKFEPNVRVRVAVQFERVTLDNAGVVTLSPGPGFKGRAEARGFKSPVTIYRASGAWLIRDGDGSTMRWSLPVLAAQGTNNLSMDGSTFPGTLVLQPSKHAPNKLDVINYVGLETYLPGVLQRELFPKWHPAAYRAQAIAARSYAIVQIARSQDRSYDLESTTASQVYAGQATNPRAIDAVRRTRGLVIAYQGRVVEAFYSSSSGGMGQDASIAFVDRAGWFDIPPLQGVRHGWGQSATYYHWGPIARDASSFARRLSAWGKANKHPIANLVGLRDVKVATTNRTGRPARFHVVDGRGQTYSLAPEQFRFAANADAPGLQPLLAADQLRSSNVQVRMSGRSVHFAAGRGYGHGVGMCQWSAQDMASRGRDETTILATFYPKSSLQNAY